MTEPADRRIKTTKNGFCIVSSGQICTLKATEETDADHCREAYGIEAIFAHDPTAFIAAIQPELFTWREGQVRVISDGFAKGKTMQDPGRKRWNVENGWTGRPKVKVGIDVKVEEVISSMLQRMSL